MAQPTRDEAISTLDGLHHDVLRLLAKVPEGEHATPGLGGGDWSVKDLLGHLAFWEELAVQAVEAWQMGERPRVEAYFAEGSDGIDRANAANQERKAAWDYEEVRADADATHATLLGLIRDMSDEEWRGKAPYETERRDTMVSMLGSIVGAPKTPFGHASAHMADLESFVTRLLG